MAASQEKKATPSLLWTSRLQHCAFRTGCPSAHRDHTIRYSSGRNWEQNTHVYLIRSLVIVLHWFLQDSCNRWSCVVHSEFCSHIRLNSRTSTHAWRNAARISAPMNWGNCFSYHSGDFAGPMCWIRAEKREFLGACWGALWSKQGRRTQKYVRRYAKLGDVRKATSLGLLPATYRWRTVTFLAQTLKTLWSRPRNSTRHNRRGTNIFSLLRPWFDRMPGPRCLMPEDQTAN